MKHPALRAEKSARNYFLQELLTNDNLHDNIKLQIIAKQ